MLRKIFLVLVAVSMFAVLLRGYMDAFHVSLFAPSHHSLPPFSTNHSQPVSSNHSQPVSSNHSQPASTNHSQPVSSDHSQPVTTNHSQPVTTNHSQPVSSNHSQPVSSNHSQPVSSNHSQPVSSDQSQPVSTNHSQPVSTNHSQPTPVLKPKQTNVVFMKTHKTGSSTMQNLLFRFAEHHNLTVALPIKECGHLFCYPRSFNTHFVHPGTLPANILTNHMHFNHAEVRRVMPINTVYITILREPASMFESMFTYFKQQCQSFMNVPSLEVFMEDPQRYYRPNEPIMAARNALTFDLGGDKDRPETDAAYIRDFVAEVERSFSLVMIAEYFDESLVLLRHLLSWDLEDVLYVKLNMRSARSKLSLGPGLTSKMRAWNYLDAKLYDHFNTSLWRKLAALGPAFVAEELHLMRQAQESLMQSCFGDRTPQLRSAWQIKNKKLRPWQPSNKVDIMGYDLPDNISHGSSSQDQKLCLKLIMPEVQYSTLLLDRETQRIS